MHTLATPIHALPLDIMRVVAGGVLFVYFANALRQARDFSDPDGLIDHRLSARLFPPTRISLFQPGMPGWVFRAVYLCACAAAVLVIVGWHPRERRPRFSLRRRFRPIAGTRSSPTWTTASSTWLCLWLVLLPVGTTLNLPDLLGAGSGDRATAAAAAAGWATETVPGTAPAPS